MNSQLSTFNFQLLEIGLQKSTKVYFGLRPHRHPTARPRQGNALRNRFIRTLNGGRRVFAFSPEARL